MTMWKTCFDHEVSFREEEGCPVCNLQSEKDNLKIYIYKLLVCIKEIQDLCGTDYMSDELALSEIYHITKRHVSPSGPKE